MKELLGGVSDVAAHQEVVIRQNGVTPSGPTPVFDQNLMSQLNKAELVTAGIPSEKRERETEREREREREMKELMGGRQSEGEEREEI